MVNKLVVSLKSKQLFILGAIASGLLMASTASTACLFFYYGQPKIPKHLLKVDK